MVVGAKDPNEGQVGMTSTPSPPVPGGQSNVDDWFDLDKYKKAAGVAYEFSKKKTEDVGTQERETVGKTAQEQRTSAEQAQSFREREERRDAEQARRAYRF